MDGIAQSLDAFAGFVWGAPLLLLLLGGGMFFAIYSRGLPYRRFRHALEILGGKYDDCSAEGELPHFHALASALSGTLGLGNVAGVAVAISVGGPGAIFWMWMSALLGVATKFFTCSLAVMYRGRDSEGRTQGGPMYVLIEGLGPQWRPLAWLFCVAGVFGTLPVFQVNQLTQIVRDVIVVPNGWVGENHFVFDLVFGIAVATFVAVVIFGGIRRIGAVAARLVPAMVLIYVAAAAYVMLLHVSEIPACFALIFRDAFSGDAAAGGAVGAVILTGVRRGAFSNEAGIGTEAMAHGAARTNEPLREGMVAMLGPVIDTLVVCTCTALVILATGAWQSSDASGVTVAADAFARAMPGLGPYLLVLVVFFLSTTTILTFWYYGAKCLGFLIGAKYGRHYRYFYVALIVAGAVFSLDAVLGLIDGMYALMAIPTMVSTVLLAPKVMEAARSYEAG